MYCNKCGAKLREGASFCPACGEKVTSSRNLSNNVGKKTGQKHEKSWNTTKLFAKRNRRAIVTVLSLVVVIMLVRGVFYILSPSFRCSVDGHDWNEATCYNPKTCKVCGTTEGVALGHNWIDATCSSPKTCSRCGITDGEKTNHELITDLNSSHVGQCRYCGKQIAHSMGEWETVKIEDYISLRIDKSNIWYSVEQDSYGYNGYCRHFPINVSPSEIARDYKFFGYIVIEGQYAGKTNLELDEDGYGQTEVIVKDFAKTKEAANKNGYDFTITYKQENFAELFYYREVDLSE